MEAKLVRVFIMSTKGRDDEIVPVGGNLMVLREFCKVTITHSGWINGLPENSRLEFFDWSDPMSREHTIFDKAVTYTSNMSIYVPLKMGVSIRIPHETEKGTSNFIFTVCSQFVVVEE